MHIQLSKFCCVFFSSRRRHTRYWRDWSSDVCSSDLRAELVAENTVESESRLENLEELMNAAREYERVEPEPTLAGFLQEQALYSEQDALSGEGGRVALMRSEEHTSELQSRQYLVCRLLLEKKKKTLI